MNIDFQKQKLVPNFINDILPNMSPQYYPYKLKF